MKLVHYSGTSATIHPQAGELQPGVNAVHDDQVADRLIAAGGAFSDGGQVMAGDEPEFVVPVPSSAGVPYHAAGGSVHHVFDDCTAGNNVEGKNRRLGTGGKPLCQECATRGAQAPEKKE